MTKEEYARMIRTMHRIMGWVFIGSIIGAPFGIYVLRRGNRLYEQLMQMESDRVLDDPASQSLVMSFDDFTSTNEDGE